MSSNALASPPPMPDYKGPLAFFRRHYNGDYSLGRSYWVNTFLVSLFAPALGLMLLPWLGRSFPARYSSAAFLLLTVLGLLIWFWAVSGTWASASKHVQRGGKAGWATAAKLLIIIGVLRTAGELVSGWPTWKEHIEVAAGAQMGPGAELVVRADGRSILLHGGINDGTAEQLEQALQAAPGVTTVVLSSSGGWIREGHMLADVIRQRSLNTYVEGYCASACTIAFLAGRDRAAAPTAQIGFHASRGVGSVGSKRSNQEVEQLRAMYQAAGLPESFIRRVIDTPHDAMWHPSHEELLAAGVLTRRSSGGETATISTAVRSKEALAAEFKKVELFALLAAKSPDDFERVIQAAWLKAQQGATDVEVTSAGRAQIGVVMPKFLVLATDDTLIAYQALIQEQLEAMRARDMAVCVEMVLPSGQPINITGNMPRHLVERELNLLAQMVREANGARAISPTPAERQRVGQRAAARMTQQQLAVIAEPEAYRQSAPASLCDAGIAFVAGLNSIPAQERGRALRVFYAGN